MFVPRFANNVLAAHGQPALTDSSVADDDSLQLVSKKLVMGRWLDELSQTAFRIRGIARLLPRARHGKARADVSHEVEDGVSRVSLTGIEADLRAFNKYGALAFDKVPLLPGVRQPFESVNAELSHCLLFLRDGLPSMPVNGSTDCVTVPAALSVAGALRAQIGFDASNEDFFLANALVSTTKVSQEMPTRAVVHSMLLRNFGTCTIDVASAQIVSIEQGTSPLGETDTQSRPETYFVRLIELASRFVPLSSVLELVHTTDCSAFCHGSSVSNSAAMTAWPLLALARRCAQAAVQLLSDDAVGDLAWLGPTTVLVGPGRDDVKFDPWEHRFDSDSPRDVPGAQWQIGAVVYEIIFGRRPPSAKRTNAESRSISTARTSGSVLLQAMSTNSLLAHSLAEGSGVSRPAELLEAVKLLADFVGACLEPSMGTEGITTAPRSMAERLLRFPFITRKFSTLSDDLNLLQLSALGIVESTQCHAYAGLLPHDLIHNTLPTRGRVFVENAIVTPAARLLASLRSWSSRTATWSTNDALRVLHADFGTLVLHCKRVKRICDAATAVGTIDAYSEASVLVLLASSNASAALDLTSLCILEAAQCLDCMDPVKMQTDKLIAQAYSELPTVLLTAVTEVMVSANTLLSEPNISARPMLMRRVLNVVAQLYTGRAVLGNGDINASVAKEHFGRCLREDMAASMANHNGSASDFSAPICQGKVCIRWPEMFRDRLQDLAVDAFSKTSLSETDFSVIDHVATYKVIGPVPCTDYDRSTSAELQGVQVPMALRRTSFFYTCLPKVWSILGALFRSRSTSLDAALIATHRRATASATAALTARKRAAVGRVAAANQVKLLENLHRLVARSSSDWDQMDALLGVLGLLDELSPLLVANEDVGSPYSLRAKALKVVHQIVACACFRQTGRVAQHVNIKDEVFCLQSSVLAQIASAAFLKYVRGLTVVLTTCL